MELSYQGAGLGPGEASMPYRLRCGDETEHDWHRKRDDALRHGENRGWTIQGPPGCYTLADGVEIEARSSPPSYRI
jgi:hypothetical protein